MASGWSRFLRAVAAALDWFAQYGNRTATPQEVARRCTFTDNVDFSFMGWE